MKLVKIKERYQNSINLKLDLNHTHLIDGFIPTRAAIEILMMYLMDYDGFQRKKATLLIGPYGKGKSHVLLVLLYLLRPTDEAVTKRLLEKITRADGQAGKKIASLIAKKKKVLPVIISFGAESLENSYRNALTQALTMNGLADLSPKSYYSEALDCMERWKQEFHATYQLLVQRMGGESHVTELRHRLERGERKALTWFEQEYPKFCAGAAFHPMIQMDIPTIYRDINDVLQREYGYDGMVIIFDEFSKFIEAETPDTVSKDMELVQEMCELSTVSARENPLYQIFVAHKPIKEYADYLSKEVLNTFTGVEGRLTELQFITTEKNNYELIQNVIEKEKEFENLAVSWDSIAEQNYYCANFSVDFTREEFEEIVVRGCYPMTPLTTFLLLKVSEKIGQNERSLMTFLANRDAHTLAVAIEGDLSEGGFVCPDLVFDHFSPVLKKDIQNRRNHKEWQKAMIALQNTTSPIEEQIIKTICLMRIAGVSERIEATRKTIAAALCKAEKEIHAVMKDMIKKELILYRDKLGSYVIRQKIDMDIEAKVRQLEEHDFASILLEKELQKVCGWDYELPRKYNNEHSMTRFFEYIFMKKEELLALRDTDLLFKEEYGGSFSDGKIILVLEDKAKETDRAKVKAKLAELKDERITAVYPKGSFDVGTVVRRWLAIRALFENDEVTNRDKVILEELEIMLEDCEHKINMELETMYQSELLRCNEGGGHRSKNEIISDICESYYGNTPRINHEMINRRILSGQMKKARGKLIARILNEDSMEEWMKGTSAEAVIYRAALVRTGLTGDARYLRPDEKKKVMKMMHLMDDFIQNAGGKKVSFGQLYQQLCGKEIGIREGTIPIYLAWKLMELEKMPVIYLGEKELVINEITLDAVNEKPSQYYLYVEKNVVKSSMYLSELVRIFAAGEREGIRWQEYMQHIVLLMQRWYRNLQPCAQIAHYEDKSITILLKKLRLGRLNARQFLFETLPDHVYPQTALADIPEKLEQTKQTVEAYYDFLLQKIEGITRTEFGIKDKSSLSASLNDWINIHQGDANKQVLSAAAIGILNLCSKKYQTDEDIVSTLGKLVTDRYVVDWSDYELASYQEKLSQYVKEIEESAKDESRENMNQLMFTNSEGTMVKKYIPQIEEDSTFIFARSAMTSAMEEFGDSLEKEQKIRACLDVLENILDNE